MTARGIGKAVLVAGRYGSDMCRSLAEHATAPGRSPSTFPRRVAEQWRLLMSNGITAEDYYHYRLDREDVSWAAKRQFIGVMNHGSWRDPLNPPAYQGFAEDKVVSSRYLAQAGVPVPPLLAVVGPHGRAATGEPVRTADELVHWLGSLNLEHVVLKPERGTRGIGILVIGERLHDAPGAAWRRVPSERIDGAGFAAHFARHRGHAWFVVEERLRPHRGLAVFGAEVLHTARVVTMMDGGVDVIGASLRIGTGASGVDNFSQGNLVAPVDVTTGRIGAGVSKAGDRVTVVRSHPRTGAAIEGFVIPDWAAALAVVTRACRRVPFSRLLGWDVGITAAGPVIVEVNACWDADVLQLAADRGLLATSLRGHLEARGMLNRLGLGIAWSASSGGTRGVR